MSHAELADFYAKAYHEKYSASDRFISEAQLENLRIAKAEERLSFLLKSMPKIESAHVLEVGCGTGSFLTSIVSHGADAIGIEPSESLSAFARKQRRLNVLTGLLADFEKDIKSKTFHIVALFHVLEHLPSPAATLLFFHSILRNKGLLYIEVPNTYSIVRLAKTRIDKYLRPVHLYNFTRRSINAYMACHGFQTISSDNSVPTRLRIIARKASKLKDLNTMALDSPAALYLFFQAWHIATKAKKVVSTFRKCANHRIALMRH